MKKLFSGLLVSVSALCAGGSALAEEWTIPGMSCDGGQFNTSAQREWWGNPGNIVCPINRPNATTLGDITNIYIRVADNTSVAGIVCQAKSCDAFGSSCFFTDVVSTSAAFEGNETLPLGSMATHSAGYAWIGCNFPGPEDGVRSKVLSLRYND